MKSETIDRLIRLPAVQSATGLAKSSLYALAARGEFPKPLKLSSRASAWRESEVTGWIAGRIRASKLETRRAKRTRARRA